MHIFPVWHFAEKCISDCQIYFFHNYLGSCPRLGQIERRESFFSLPVMVLLSNNSSYLWTYLFSPSRNMATLPNFLLVSWALTITVKRRSTLNGHTDRLFKPVLLNNCRVKSCLFPWPLRPAFSLAKYNFYAFQFVRKYFWNVEVDVYFPYCPMFSNDFFKKEKIFVECQNVYSSPTLEKRRLFFALPSNERKLTRKASWQKWRRRTKKS